MKVSQPPDPPTAPEIYLNSMTTMWMRLLIASTVLSLASEIRIGL